MVEVKSTIKCDECGSEEYVKAGKGWRVVTLHPKVRKSLQQYRCKKCGHIFVDVNDYNKE